MSYQTSFEDVYRQATGAHRAASTFRGVSDEYGGGEQQGVQMPEYGEPHTTSGPPPVPAEALNSPSYDGSQKGYEFSSKQDNVYSTMPQVSVDVTQDPAMRPVLLATQIIFQAGDTNGRGTLTRETASYVLDMVWGDSVEEEMGPKGALRLSFERAFEQSEELTVESFLAILAKVGAPAPYRSQELEYSLITTAKNLQDDEETTLDWRAIFLPVVLLGLAAFNAGFALDVCYKALPSVLSVSTCKAQSIDYRPIVNDAYGNKVIYMHAPVVLFLHVVAILGLSAYSETGRTIGSRRKSRRFLWDTSAALDVSMPGDKSTWYILCLATSCLSPVMMVIVLLTKSNVFSKDEHTLQLLALNYAFIGAVILFRGMLSLKPRTDACDMSAKRDANELRLCAMTVPHWASMNSAYDLATHMVNKASRENVWTRMGTSAFPFVLLFVGIPVTMGFTPMFIKLFDEKLCWGTYDEDHGVLTVGFIITSFFSLIPFQMECFDIASVLSSREKMTKLIGGLLSPSGALEMHMPYLNLALPGNMQAWMKTRYFFLKHFLVGESSHPWLPNARGGWGLDILVFSHYFCLFMLALSAFQQWKIVVIQMAYFTFVTGYFAFSGEGALASLTRTWENVHSYEEFLHSQAVSLNRSFDVYMTGYDFGEVQSAIRDLARSSSQSVKTPPRVLGIPLNGVTLMAWRLVSVVIITVSMTIVCYWP